MKTVMITGSTGFVGKNFIENYSKEYKIIPIDLRKKSPEDLDYKNVDSILHLAAIVHKKKIKEEEYCRINTELTIRLAECAKKNGVKQFVFCSTVAVFGVSGYFDNDRIIDLKTLPTPNTFYGKSKLEAEEKLFKIKSKDFKIFILRPPMIYGENSPGYENKIFKLIKFSPVLPFDYSKNKITRIDVKKLSSVIDDVIKNEKDGITIPKDEKDVSIKEIVEKIAKEKNRKIVLFKMPKFVFFILCKIRPNIMSALYGNSRFKD